MPPLLFLAQRIPYPPDKGDKLRSFAVLRHLAQSWDIHLGCFIDDPADLVHIDALRPFCAEMCCIQLDKSRATRDSAGALLLGGSLSERYFRSAKLAKWVDRSLIEFRPQAAFIYSAVMGQYLLGHSANSLPRMVVDLVDVDSEKWRQYAEFRSGPIAWVYQRESRSLLRFERRLVGAAAAAIFVSAPEAALFRAKAPDLADKLHAISNGVDHGFFAPNDEFPNPFAAGQQAIVMTGAMDYWPNIDAGLWFVEQMLPRLRASQPAAHFYLVGRNPPRQLRKLAEQQGVHVTGRVDDVRPYLQHAAAVIAPMRVARGIQNKILEGMAMAKAVVTSSAGLEGIDARPGQDLLLADTPDQFIDVLQDLLRQPAKAASIGAAARRRILQDYDWRDKLQSYAALLQDG
jgi:sugar transferase (PEP-CTERM/EpsH1 system associated)